MTENLKRNLTVKRLLRFRADGSFKILMLSDYQESLACDPRSLSGTEALLEAEHPDLIILGGDNCNSAAFRDPEPFRDYLTLLTRAFADRHIPWCHIYGNHDHELPFPEEVQNRIYDSFPDCLTKTVPGIPGSTNFCLPILASAGNDVRFAVWGLDSGDRIDSLRVGLNLEARPEGRLPISGPWDVVRFEQLLWYWNSSRELEKYAGGKVPSLMALHIAPWEFQNMQLCPEATQTTGASAEGYNLGTFNSGLFATVLQRGDVRCICSGHTHENTCCGVYCGVTLCNDGSAGYSAYGVDELRGGRVFEISESDPAAVQTRMAFYKDHR